MTTKVVLVRFDDSYWELYEIIIQRVKDDRAVTLIAHCKDSPPLSILCMPRTEGAIRDLADVAEDAVLTGLTYHHRGLVGIVENDDCAALIATQVH